MNTLFEVVLVGGDEENLRAAGEAALDEIVRVEKLLSRFDPTSETSRINREGHSDAVTVDHEIVQVLRRCHEFSRRTDGHFDVTAVSRADQSWGPPLVFDPDRRLLAFRYDNAFLDFGACGKGYALDRAARMLCENGVARALLHGGTSSIRAIGEWTVDVRDPFETSATIGQIRLRDEGMSCSAVAHGGEVSDIVDPMGGEQLNEQAACVVITNGGWSAFDSEMFSTGLLAMGRERAGVCCRRGENRGVHVGWIGQSHEVEWLSELHD
jgi:thiamine biosynthesis lipoprotein